MKPDDPHRVCSGSSRIRIRIRVRVRVLVLAGLAPTPARSARPGSASHAPRLRPRQRQPPERAKAWRRRTETERCCRRGSSLILRILPPAPRGECAGRLATLRGTRVCAAARENVRRGEKQRAGVSIVCDARKSSTRLRSIDRSV